MTQQDIKVLQKSCSCFWGPEPGMEGQGVFICQCTDKCIQLLYTFVCALTYEYTLTFHTGLWSPKQLQLFCSTLMSCLSHNEQFDMQTQNRTLKVKLIAVLPLS